MDPTDIKKNHWYLIGNIDSEIGVKAKCVDVCGKYITVKYYWGAPFRIRNVVFADQLVSECNRPSLFSNF